MVIKKRKLQYVSETVTRKHLKADVSIVTLDYTCIERIILGVDFGEARGFALACKQLYALCKTKTSDASTVDFYRWSCRTKPLVLSRTQQNDHFECSKKYWCDAEKLVMHIPLLEKDLNELMRTSCYYGHLLVMKKILDDKRVDPAARENEAIRVASGNGHASLVKLLLKDSRVDPSDCTDRAFRNASMHGHISVVRLLLKDKRVDPSACGNSALFYALINGHLSIVELLLKDKRVGTKHISYAIQLAYDHGHLAAVEALLKDSRIDSHNNISSSIYFSDIFTKALTNNHTSVVELMIEYKRIHYSLYWHDIVDFACKHGSVSIVKQLLKDMSLDPSKIGNYAILKAYEHGCFSMVETLLNDTRVDLSDFCKITSTSPLEFFKNLFASALRRGHSSLTEALIKDTRIDLL